MIFHVAISTHGVGRKVPLELIEDDIQRLIEDVGENVQTAAVSHAHDDLLDPSSLAILDSRIERQDQGFAASREKRFRRILWRKFSKVSAS